MKYRGIVVVDTYRAHFPFPSLPHSCVSADFVRSLLLPFRFRLWSFVVVVDDGGFRFQSNRCPLSVVRCVVAVSLFGVCRLLCRRCVVAGSL